MWVLELIAAYAVGGVAGALAACTVAKILEWSK